MRGTTRTLAAVAFAVFTALGAASAGERRAARPFSCVEAQVPKRASFWDYDDSGDPFRVASFEQVGRFSGVVRLPIDDLGPTFRRLDPAALFAVSIGNVQYTGRLSDSNYVQGRPSATFDIVPGDMDPDTGVIGPPWVKARVTWTRKRVTVAVTGRQSVLLADPPQENVVVDDQSPMSVAFYGAKADLDVRVTGSVKNRFVVDGFGVSIPLTTVKLRGAGVVRAQ
jgi:hypothetical protein